MLIELAIIAIGIGAGTIAEKCTKSSDGNTSDSSSSYSDDNDWGLAGQGNDPGFWITYP